MIKNKSKFFAMDGPWGSSSGNNKPGSGGGFSGEEITTPLMIY